MQAIWKAAVGEFEKGQDFVLATILVARGSSPRHTGTRFLIRKEGTTVGTIGGGLFEANVQRFAAEALKNGTSHRALFSFSGPDTGSADMICGGEAEVLVEFVNAANKTKEHIFRRLAHNAGRRTPAYWLTLVAIAPGESTSASVEHLFLDKEGGSIGGFAGDDIAVKALPERRLLKPFQLIEVPGLQNPVFLEWVHPRGTVYIFGAGHVGVCVAHLATYVDFKVVVLDDREEFANLQRIPVATEVVVAASFVDAFSALSADEDSYIVIVTRGHAHDKTVLSHALRTRAGYIGMIGSRRKTSLIYEALLKEGFTQADLSRVHAPIGLPIGGETPEEIGMSIVAEMIAVRNGKGGKSAHWQPVQADAS
jgi:xanthine dehydrogenase accessory factor